MTRLTRDELVERVNFLEDTLEKEQAEVERLRAELERCEQDWKDAARAALKGGRGVMATYSANSVPNPPRKLCYVEDHARLYFEVERLRAALERISEMWTGIDTASSIARAALKGGGE
jgi:uncharacterized small protein (DUF1192 family)